MRLFIDATVDLLFNARMETPRTFARALRKNQTEAESRLWFKLRNRQMADRKFRRQVPIEGFVVDFACKDSRVIIELDGGQHSQQARYDAGRTRTLEAAGFLILRFWNSHVLENLDGVLETIHRTLEPDLYKNNR